MNTNDLNTALYEKMAAEQDKYRDWLKSQPPEEILNHTYEYTIREDIVMAMEELELTDAQAQALLGSPSPLADVYRYFEKLETGYMDVIRDSIENRADDVCRAKEELQTTPVYDNKNNVDTLALKLAKKVGELMGTTQAGRTATRKNSSGGEYYGVLRGARAVGTPYYMLIEHSFHTNTKATKWLSEDANLDKLAVAEADILAEFFGMESSTTTEKTAIMGKAQATASQMAAFCLSKNASPQLPSCTVEELARMFIEEGEAEGVRGDVAFAQSLHETGYFKFGGIVLPSQNNYAGIGALNGNATGQAASFPDPRTGVRAQIQHLKAYASTEALVNACVDPRFSLVARGVAPYVEWLGAADNPQGRGWAVPGAGYGANIVKLLGQILAFQDPGDGYPEGTPDWQKAGFEALVERGIINSPDVWKAKFDQPIKVGEILAIIGRM